MHANKREDINEVTCGNIAAAVGLRVTTTGDTLCDEKRAHRARAHGLPGAGHLDRDRAEDAGRPGEARLRRWPSWPIEDPSFSVKTDAETGQTLISGMGELHLEIIVDRLVREFKLEAYVGRPQVAYRETITREVEGEGKYIRQTGGRGLYGHVVLRVEPMPSGKGVDLRGSPPSRGAIPREFMPSVERACASRWRAACWPATR